MKTRVAVSPVEHFGEISHSKEFGFKKTAKAFQVLLSKLYKNKVAAVVRELSCNAYDSHVEAGNADIPFDVHLPTALEPYFSIRDYGTGLSGDQIDTFVTLFESTKENSNRLIGNQGLGSKSPFALVNSFTIYTYNGRARTSYLCYREDGIPKRSDGVSIASNEPVGIEITFSVEANDCDKFMREAQAVFQWFTVRPNITGAKINIPAMPALKGSFWSAFPGGLYAVMGQVRYPIDPEEVDTRLHGLTLHFDIGDIDVQAGREELSYDRETIAAIKAKIALAEAEIAAIYNDVFKDCNSVFDAVAAYLKAVESHLLFSIIPPKWNGMTISNSVRTTLRGVASVEISTNGPSDNDIPLDQYAIFINDRCTREKQRFNMWRQRNHKPPTMVITPMVGVDKIVEVLKGSEIVLASSVVLPSVKAKLRTLGEQDLRHRPEREIDLTTGGLFVYSRNLAVIGPDDNTLDKNNTQSLYRLLLANDSPMVVVVPWSRRGEMGEGWTNAFDLLEEKYRANCEQKEFQEKKEEARRFRKFDTTITGVVCRRIHDMLKDRLDDGPVKSFIADWDICRKSNASHGLWCVYENIMGPKPTEEINSLRREWDCINDNYPLLIETTRIRTYGDTRLNERAIAPDLAHYVNSKTKSILEESIP